MARETINGISVPVPGTGEPADFQGDLRRFATDLPASTITKWKPNTAYTVGQIVAAPDGSLVERTVAGTSGASFSNTNWKTATGLATQIAAGAAGSAPRFGPLSMPAGFPTLPATFYRDNDGIIRHTFDFAAYYPATATKIHLSMTGNDASGDGTSGSPYRTLVKAMEVVQAGGAGAYVIDTGDIAMFDRDQAGFTGTITGKTVAIRSALSTRCVLSANSTYTWTADGTGTYTTARSSVLGVIDNSVRDHKGMPVALKSVASVAACQAEAGTYYSSGTAVWVHRNDNALPTHDSTIVSIGVLAFDPVLAGGSKLYVEGLIFCGTASGVGLRVRGDAGGTEETFLAKDCKFIGSSGNCYTTLNLARTYLFDCVAAYGQRDGFGYSYDGMTWATARANALVVEYGCTAYHLGIESPGAGPTYSNNTSTGHHGANILRIAHVGYECTGTPVIDVNGCFSVLFDCHARTPVLVGEGGAQTPGQGTTFSFSSDVNPDAGKVYMYDCGAADCTTALTVGSGTTAEVARFRKPSSAAIAAGGTIIYLT